MNLNVNNKEAIEAIMGEVKNRILSSVNYKYAHVQSDGALEDKENYDIHDFTQYCDKDFVTNAFRGILKREPDQAGLNHYLQMLRSGNATRLEILYLIRFSKEGRKIRTDIRGLSRFGVFVQIYRVPLLGSAIKNLVSMLTLPKLKIAINRLESTISVQLTNFLRNQIELRKLIDQKANIQEIDAKADIRQLRELRALMEDGLQSKADISDLKHIEHHIENNLQGKADISELKHIKDYIEHGLQGKADISELKYIKDYIENSLQGKADISKLKHIEHHIENSLQGKADISELKYIKDYIENELQSKTSLSQVKEFMEVPAVHYLNSAIELFAGSVEDFGKLDKDELYYSLFQNAFYDHGVVVEKQKIYLDYIKKVDTKKWLDVGCGRGEFIENLTARGIPAVGVDINALEIARIRKRGLKAFCMDAIEYLTSSDEKYAGISVLQVAEHFEKDYLRSFLRIAYEKIAEDGLIIMETINPHNPLGFGNFYVDDSHKNPLPPELMTFLLQWYGFKKIKVVYSGLLPEEFRCSDLRRNYHDFAVIGHKR